MDPLFYLLGLTAVAKNYNLTCHQQKCISHTFGSCGPGSGTGEAQLISDFLLKPSIPRNSDTLQNLMEKVINPIWEGSMLRV